ncbi:MAG TPA: peptidase MA family metallohydrolase, partial [Labilithrix sp.]|nr:peptidase MA family metallohydrolase [Labilithrix sp.]
YLGVSSRIQPSTMAALVRMLFAAVVALVMVLGASPAKAQELREAPAAAAGRAADGPVPTLPSDVPLIAPGEAVIPAVPSAYLTRDLGWLKLAYPPAAAERVASLIRDADAFKAELSETLGQAVLGHVEVRITPTVSDMTRLAPLGSPPPAYASGVAYSRLHLVLISMFAPRGADATDLDQVFRHELAHVALEDAVLGQHVPVWFNEGLAIGLAGENSFERQDVLFHATVYGTLLPLADLDRSFPHDHADVGVAYAESADFLRFLMRRTDRVRFAAMVQRVRESQTFDRALADAYGSDLRKLEFQWRSELERHYSVIPILAGGGIIWVAVIGALGWGYVKKRRRARAILAKWAQDEAIEDALLARRAAEAAEESDRDLVHMSLRGIRAPAKVEHEGDWHTLH